MEFENFAIRCPHCGLEIDFEKATDAFKNLTDAYDLKREKLFCVCKLYIQIYKNFPHKLKLVSNKETEIKECFEKNHNKMTQISGKIYEKLQNIEKELNLI